MHAHAMAVTAMACTHHRPYTLAQSRRADRQTEWSSTNPSALAIMARSAWLVLSAVAAAALTPGAAAADEPKESNGNAELLSVVIPSSITSVSLVAPFTTPRLHSSWTAASLVAILTTLHLHCSHLVRDVHCIGLVAFSQSPWCSHVCRRA
jgi:hypothetical protein